MLHGVGLSILVNETSNMTNDSVGWLAAVHLRSNLIAPPRRVSTFNVQRQALFLPFQVD